MREIWKDIPCYEGLYQVSDIGRVRVLDRIDARGYRRNGKIMSTPLGAHGYKIVNLTKDGVSTVINVHQLVAIAFLGHKPNGYDAIIDHIDNVRTNNNVSNLQITSSRVNASKDVKNKTSKYTGVCYVSRRGVYQAQIKINGRNNYLGYFKCETAAHLAYQKALKELL